MFGIIGQRELEKMMSGTKVKISLAMIVNNYINLPDAQRKLDKESFEKVYELYKKYRVQKTKEYMNYDTYMSKATQILEEFDEIAPVFLYGGM